MESVFSGLLYIPATDLNFKSGVERLTKDDLIKMLYELKFLQSKGEPHKGRINAVTTEIKKRIKHEASVETYNLSNTSKEVNHGK